ncbi:MAG: methyltransferase domain-containing protein [Christensenella sp.]|nr:methyltransferase domain-containing protein [Christensenella sp.]
MDNSTGKRPPSGGASSHRPTGGKLHTGQKPAPRGAKPYGEKRAYSENKPYSGKPSSESKPYSGNKPYSEKKPFSDKKFNSEYKPYSDKKPYSQGKPYTERKPFSGPKYAPKSPATPRQEEAVVTEQQLQVLVSAIATEPVTSLSALATHAKKRAARELLERVFDDRAILYAALAAPEPKARKNAARLLGAFANERDADALVAALQSEETRYVIPSILLALGAIAGTKAGAAVTAYVPPAAADETEEKHVQDIIEAHTKALAALEKDVPLPQRTRLASAMEILLVPPVGFGSILLKEATSRGFAATLHNDGVRVFTDQIKTLQELRCAQEILLPLAASIPIDSEQISTLANPVLTRPYRIELRNYAGDRAALIRAVSTALGGGDNPSRYADELRIVCNNDKCDVFIRPRNVADTRFAYRKRALPASIHPVQAACLARYALSFVSAARPRTLDPFCGSGTLLFELERAVPTGLIGVDISERALDAARENATAAHSGARFVHKDILKFEPREPFDLILANMPFGNRVGTHSANETLYRDFAHALPKLLASDGVAVLYTMEHRLLTTCLQSEPGLSVTAELTTEAGGLNPRVTVVRKK